MEAVDKKDIIEEPNISKRADSCSNYDIVESSKRLESWRLSIVRIFLFLHIYCPFKRLLK